VRPCLPWLGQGDIFSSVPIVDASLQEDGTVAFVQDQGPAVLLTHDCAMDKPHPTDPMRPKIPRLQFARLRAVGDEDRQRMRSSAARLGPFDVCFLGVTEPYGECFILLDETYYLPAALFNLHFVDPGEDVMSGNPDAVYATARANDNRIGRIQDDQLDLLRRKMIAYWTRQQT